MPDNKSSLTPEEVDTIFTKYGVNIGDKEQRLVAHFLASISIQGLFMGLNDELVLKGLRIAIEIAELSIKKNGFEAEADFMSSFTQNGQVGKIH